MFNACEIKRSKGITTDILKITTHRKKSNTRYCCFLGTPPGLNSNLLEPQLSRLYSGEDTRQYLPPRVVVKGFLSELPGSLPPRTEGWRFSSRDALPCARRGDQRGGEALAGGRVAEAGGRPGQDRLGRSFDVQRGGFQQEHAKCIHTVQNTLSVRVPVCARC